MTLRDTYPLHQKKIIKKTVSTVVGTVFLFGILGLCFFASALAWNPLVALACLAVGFPAYFILIYLYQKEYFRVYGYDLSERGLDIKKGVFFPNAITLPLEKISDVYVDQDIFDRIFGLYDLHFSSASLSSGNLSHIDGMDKKTTDSLRAFLMGELKGERPEKTAGAVSAKGAEADVLAVFKPDPKGYWMQLFGAFIGTTVFLLILFFPLVLLMVLLAIPLAILIKKEFDSQIYTLQSDGIHVRRGWLTPSETLIFYKNIQDINSTQDFLSLLVGLQTLTVKSMSYQSAISSRFSYLSAADAKFMHGMLTARIERHIKTAEGAARPKAANMPGSPEAKIAGYTGQIRTNPYPNEFVLGQMVGISPIFVIAPILIFMFVFIGLSSIGLGVQIALFIVASIGIDLLFAAIAFVGAFISKSVYSYTLGPDGLTIQTGLFSKYKRTIRYEKIQDIRLYCSFLESFVGLATIHVETGSRDFVVRSRSEALQALLTERIPYLKLADAYALRAKLLEITAMDYPKSKTPLREAMPLSKKKPLKKTVGSFGILSVQILLVLVLGSVLVPAPYSWVAIGFLVLSVLYTIVAVPVHLWYENLYMKKYFYDENREVLIIRKGVFGWSEIVVPYRNIQSIYVDQDWYDVYYDLWDVWITTVTDSSGPMAHIDGLAREDAERLARLLVERVESSRKK